MSFLEKQKNSYPQTALSVNSHSSWVEIDKHAFFHNITQYKQVASSAYLAAVIKSNAYGHGIEVIAKLCEQNADVYMIAVVSLSEALFLRSIDIQKPILVLSFVDQDLLQAVVKDIDIVIWDYDVAVQLNECARLLGKTARVHVKVDTGLSRVGLSCAEAFKLTCKMAELQSIDLSGIFTHFSESESDDQAFTNHQIALFNDLIGKLKENGIEIPLRHTSCSAAVTANANSHFTMVRAGIGLYGLWPSAENKNSTFLMYPQFNLKPVMRWKTRIMQIKHIPQGSYVGYDRTYQTVRPTTIAVLPIGYWDGYDRQLSNQGKVLINNQLAPVIGRVAMNLMMVDVTDIHAAKGDEVILLGNAPGVTADNIAAACGTINYEIVTRVNPLLPRIVI